MRRLVFIMILGLIAWQGYTKYQSYAAEDANAVRSLGSTTEGTPSSAFRCDGRTHCSQMTSCAEATFFLKNCPDVKMDGDLDGIACEQQWRR